MPAAPRTLAPQQARSRATADRLLAATIAVLERKGLDGAVIPEIAATAGVAPASVYRRYADKDALLRAAFLRFLQQRHEANRERFRDALLRDTLGRTARRLVRLLFAQYRIAPGLARALFRYLEADTNAEFLREARAVLQANVDLVVDVLLEHRDEMTRLPTRKEARFALIQCAASVQLYMMDPNALWHARPSFREADLAELLARSLVAFLQGPPAGARDDRRKRR